MLMGIACLGLEQEAVETLWSAVLQFDGAVPITPSYWGGISILCGGALCITLLFRFISLGLIEKRMLKKRPAFAERIKSVSALIPLPPKRLP